LEVVLCSSTTVSLARAPLSSFSRPHPPSSTLFPYTTLFRSWVGGHELRATASIGVALFPDHGRTASQLLAHADVAMYRAKLNGRSEEHTSELQSRENLVCRLLLEQKKTHVRRREASVEGATH